MPLFNEKIVATALQSFDDLQADEAKQAASIWADRARHENFDLQNESQLEQEFNEAILKRVLGYAPTAMGAPGTMQVKQPIPGGTTVDVALGNFQGGQATILAPLELKGPKVPLDRIMPGRAKTPVQQAWDYAMDAPGAQWVLVSNMKELRLYAFGHGRQAYETFDLRKIDQSDELRKLRFLLGVERLLGGATKALLQKSENADRQVTNELYATYKELRTNLMGYVRDQHPSISIEQRIRAIQTLLDRVLFIAFAEDRKLLPENTIRDAVEYSDPYFPRPKWDRVRKLFEYVDKGDAPKPPYRIPPYNGGLFAVDPLIDSLDLPDHLVEQFAKIAGYDFESEVSVNILGHIFEQSITDLENEKAEAHLAAPAPSASKKKREGVVYTPDFITRFIVDQTIGQHLREIEEALLPQYGKRADDGEIRWKNKTSAEADFWAEYLARITRLRVLDPACGSGAFLIAAFDHLYAEQRRVRDRLGELRPGLLVREAANADVEIITNNLFGVDVNAESVEITKLALWLQTAKRDRALESLDGNIKHGNSVVEAGGFDTKPFHWETEFADILKDGGGFDIVIGNPPYVRMELLKGIKPHLQQRFAVAADRADLYAYFYELGVKLLAPGGRLGYISSSTFFRTGSGEPLRRYLSANAQFDSVIDFGDLQVFEGVTTYPAILILRKGGEDAELRYLNARALPDDLSRTFREQSLTMPRERLGSGAWRFESDLLDTIRAKMASGRRTLADVYGPPLYGIKTGLNEAFVLTREQRDALLARDLRSAELLKPFLVGANVGRWQIANEDLWLIYTPRNAIDIDDYPAVRDHLLPFRDRLERRATNQAWWELQQAQAEYSSNFDLPKIVFERFQSRPTFAFDPEGRSINNALWCISGAGWAETAVLNSIVFHFFIRSVTTPLAGGYYQIQAHQISDFPWPNLAQGEALSSAAQRASIAKSSLTALRHAGQHRLSDLSRQVFSGSVFLDWPSLTFLELQALLKKRCKLVIPVSERDDWEAWFNARKTEAATLSAQIEAAEAEIDAIVYRLFELTSTEIAAIEDALALASPGLSLKAYEAISAVEGLTLTKDARKRLAAA